MNEQLGDGAASRERGFWPRDPAPDKRAVQAVPDAWAAPAARGS